MACDGKSECQLQASFNDPSSPRTNCVDDDVSSNDPIPCFWITEVCPNYIKNAAITYRCLDSTLGVNVPSNSDDSSCGDYTGVIVGSVIGALAVFGLTVGAAILYIHKAKHNKNNNNGDMKYKDGTASPPSPSSLYSKNRHLPWLLGRGSSLSGISSSSGGGCRNNNKTLGAYDIPETPFLKSVLDSKNQNIAEDPVLNWVAADMIMKATHQKKTHSKSSGGGSSEHGVVDGMGTSTTTHSNSGIKTTVGATAMNNNNNDDDDDGSGGALLDLRPWHFPFEMLSIEKQIGDGSYGIVYLATWQETKVAAKVLMGPSSGGGGMGHTNPYSTGGTTTTNSYNNSNNAHNSSRSAAAAAKLAKDPEMLRRLQEEASLMASLLHPNVVQFLGTCTSPPCIVSEYCERGSLADLIQLANRCPPIASQLTWRRRLQMALEAAQGMLFLHNHKPQVIHRDLKSPNLLVDQAWVVKIGDFNLSRFLDDNSSDDCSDTTTNNNNTRAITTTTGEAGNPRWLAPEIVSGEGSPSVAGDVFAYGVVLWELMTWQFPWADKTVWGIVNIVGRGERLRVPRREEMPGPDGGEFGGYDGYVRLMEKCWAQKAGDRPGFGDIIGDIRKIKEACGYVGFEGGQLN
jgi:hypothetical protein